MKRVSTVLTIVAAVAAAEAGEKRNIEEGSVIVERMAARLNVPWSIAWLPGCSFLVTQRSGEIVHVDAGGSRHKLKGVPEVRASGQGGMLDVAVARDFEQTRQIFISYSKPQGQGSGTALALATISPEADRLTDMAVLFEMAPGSSGRRHYGSRIVEAEDGTVFLTIGERGDRPSAQDLSNHNGTVVRIRRDGSIPDSNPFAASGSAQPEIWSYGHRNPQGAALDAEGRLWVNEHGARGGDEINLVERGRNYGWPVISYGVHYSGRKIGEGVSKEGMEQPKFYWDPSIAPSGLAIYSGRLWPQWEGQMFSGSLKLDFISRVDPKSGFREAERLKFPETRRVRDVREAPDGTIWFISEDRGSVYRMMPDGFEPECSSRSR